MALIKHVLAATDLSPASLHAVDRAFDIARTTGARLTLMNALGLDALGPLRDLLGMQAEGVAGTLVDKQRASLQAVAADPARSKGRAADVRVEEGLAARVVPAYAASSDADLVVVGSRGEGTLRRFLIGSTASHLLRKSHCPVLVVKRAFRTPYRRVLLAVDFSAASLLAIRAGREVAPKADLSLLNVFDVPFEGMLSFAGVTQDIISHYRIEARQKALAGLHELAARAELAPGAFAVHVQHGDSAESILDLAERERCDLIVMGKHGTHVTEELLLGSVTKHVLSESKADLLVVIDKELPPPASP